MHVSYASPRRGHGLHKLDWVSHITLMHVHMRTQCVKVVRPVAHKDGVLRN